MNDMVMHLLKAQLTRITIIASNIELSKMAGVHKDNGIIDIDKYEEYRKIINTGLKNGEGSIELINKLEEKITPDILFWIPLYELEKDLINQHRYSDAYTVRRISGYYTLWMFDKKIYISNKFKILWDLIEDNRVDDAIKLAKDLKKNAILKITKEKIQTIITILSGNYSHCRCNSIFSLDTRDTEVVVVGPLASSTNDDCKNKGRYIAINFTNKKKGIFYASFYNGEMSDNIEKTNIELPCEQVEKYCFYNIKHSFQRVLFKKGRARLIWGADYIFGLGQPNMMQNILFHLIHENSKSIYLTGFNMYLSQNVYGDDWKNYAIYDQKSKNDVSFLAKSKGFAVHNVISQFIYTKCLYDRGWFQCDNMLQRIMDDGLEVYLERLQKLAEERMEE